MAPRYDAPPALDIDPARTYEVVLHTADGRISVRLLPELAPRTVASFLFLAGEGFYDGTTFHRVIPGFIAQAGDPSGSGTGGPGYRIPDELSERSFVAGTVGMANAGPGTNGSQFFITLADATHLDGRFTLFGELTGGMEILQALRPRDPSADDDPEAGERVERVEIVADDVPQLP